MMDFGYYVSSAPPPLATLPNDINVSPWLICRKQVFRVFLLYFCCQYLQVRCRPARTFKVFSDPSLFSNRCAVSASNWAKWIMFWATVGTKNPATISFFCKNVFPLEAETTASSALEQKITLFIISLLSVTCRTHIEKGRQTVNSKKCFRKSIFVFKNGTSLVSFSFIFGLFT